MSDIAVDASVAAKLLLPEAYSDKAITLFEDAVGAGLRVVAPHLLPVEITNVVRRHMRHERLPLSDALVMLDDFLWEAGVDQADMS